MLKSVKSKGFKPLYDNPGFSTQIENIDGKWVILTKEAMQQFGCPDGLESAYVLAYNTGTKQQLLLEKKNLKQLTAASNEAEMCVSSGECWC